MKKIIVLLMVLFLTACGADDSYVDDKLDDATPEEEFDFSVDRFPELLQEAIEIEIGTVYKDGVFNDYDYMYVVIEEAGYYSVNVSHASIYTYITIAEDKENGFSIMQKEPSESFLQSRYYEAGTVYIKWHNNVSEASEDSYWEFSFDKDE